jgi:hypothetical protein
MATQAYLHDGPSFIFYLLSQQRTNARRRLAKFNLVYEQNRVAGYFWRNPLTGFNYAYRMRLDNADQAKWQLEDAKLKVCAWMGLVAGLISVLYAGVISKPWYWYPLLVVGTSAVETELIGAFGDYYVLGKFATLAEFQYSIEGQYLHTPGAKAAIDSAFKGDPEYAASKLWFQYHQDKLGLIQGSSVVTNTLGGFAFHKFWWKGLRHRHGWLTWMLGLLAQYPTLDATIAMGYDMFATKTPGDVSAADPSLFSHIFHFVGFVTGCVLSAYY